MIKLLKNAWGVLGRRRGPFAALVLAALALNGVVTVANPFFLKYSFDEGIIKNDFTLFVLASAGFMIVATLWRLANLAVDLGAQRIKHAVVKEVTTRLLKNYFRLPFGEVSGRGAAYFASRVYDEPREACEGALDLALEVGTSLVVFLVSLAVVVALSLKATAILLPTVPLLLYLGKRYGRGIDRNSRDEKEREGGLRNFLAKAMQAHRVVNMFGLLDRVVGGFQARLLGYVESSYGRLKGTRVHNTLGSILVSKGEMLVILACGYEILGGRMTFGGFMAFMNAFWIALGALRTMVEKGPEVSKVNALLGRLIEFESAGGAAAPVVSTGERVELEKAWIKLGDKVVFTDLSLSIAPGEKVLLSGKNGSGKSTVANVIAGHLRPCGGVARTPGMGRVSACIAPHHFIPGTVSDNLPCEGLDSTAWGYWRVVAAELDLCSCLDKAPDDLSAGQKKKLEIAMGLLKEADLYLFDEPLANVDENSKEKIIHLIFERAASKSLLVVMHGDSVFQEWFDRVIYIQSPGDANLP